MKPRIVHLASLTLAGMSFYGDPFDTRDAWSEENQIGRLWTRFMGYLHRHGSRVHQSGKPGVAFEVHVYHDETLEKGYFEVFAGVQINNPGEAPVELLVKSLPAADYAVFTLEGQQILSDWVTHIDQWLVEAGYRRCNPFSFQLYDERFKGIERLSESILDVYVPVEKAG